MKELYSTGLKHTNNTLYVLDQQLLPHKEEWVECQGIDHMVEIIKKLKVRGAPLIGVSAALALAKWAEETGQIDKSDLLFNAQKLRESRPTAVNLMMAIDRMIEHFNETPSASTLVKVAQEIFEEDKQLCDSMGKIGSELVFEGDRLLTHCNAGSLATAGIGTALGVFYQAHQQKKKIHVYVDETRPLLQGGRLTTYELKKWGIPYTLICDNMASYLMQQKKIDKIFVGADRIATNGDFANKIGTYSLAVLAQYHQIPFYVVAPYTTVDTKIHSGKEIPIEQRQPEEVKGVKGSFGDVCWAPEDSQVYNPAFDITPSHLVTKFIFDHGSYTPKQLQDL